MVKSKNLKIVGIRPSISDSSLHGIVVKILKQSNKPMRVRDILDKVMKIRKIKSKTPLNSIVNTLQTSKYVVRTGYGLYRYKS